jgi:hypothetical protein
MMPGNDLERRQTASFLHSLTTGGEFVVVEILIRVP